MEIIRGDTIEEKFASIEQTLKQFQRRLSTKVIGLLPPVPLLHSQAAPDNAGVFFAAISPVSGICVRVCLRIGIYTVNPIRCRFRYGTPTMYNVYERELRETIEVFPVDMPVHIGDTLEMSVEPPNSIGDILVAVLIVPDIVGQMRQEAFSLDQFLQLERREERENTDKHVVNK